MTMTTDPGATYIVMDADDDASAKSEDDVASGKVVQVTVTWYRVSAAKS